MADPQDRPDAGSGAIPPAPRKDPDPRKAAPKKAPAKAAKKAPAKKSAAKKAPAKAVKKTVAKKAPPRPTQPLPESPAPTAPVDADGAPSSTRVASHPVSPPAQPARNSRSTRIPVAIGLAATSLFAMLIRRLRRH